MLAVRGLVRSGFCDIVSGFWIVSTFAVTAFVLGLFLTYRSLRIPPLLACASTVTVAIASWPLSYCLSNVYQVCDALAYPLALGFIVAVVRDRPQFAALIGILACGCRQQLIVLTVLGGLSRFLSTRRWSWLAAVGVFLACFACLVCTAGVRGADGLLEHTVERHSPGTMPFGDCGSRGCRLSFLHSCSSSLFNGERHCDLLHNSGG